MSWCLGCSKCCQMNDKSEKLQNLKFHEFPHSLLHSAILISNLADLLLLGQHGWRRWGLHKGWTNMTTISSSYCIPARASIPLEAVHWQNDLYAISYSRASTATVPAATILSSQKHLWTSELGKTGREKKVSRLGRSRHELLFRSGLWPVGQSMVSKAEWSWFHCGPPLRIITRHGFTLWVRSWRTEFATQLRVRVPVRQLER